MLVLLLMKNHSKNLRTETCEMRHLKNLDTKSTRNHSYILAKCSERSKREKRREKKRRKNYSH